MKVVAPRLESLICAIDSAEEIQNFVKAHPCEDYIYYFPNLKTVKEDCVKINIYELLKENPKNENIVVAGSAALWYLQHRIFYTAKRIVWEASDTDIFFLNSVQNSRFSLGPTDLVMAKEKNVEELLLNFDLGCCRVAFDFQLNFWVSAQCLNAIFTHKYPMPNYLKEKIVFNKTLNLHREKDLTHVAEDMLYNRFIERIRKYSNRGFGAKWVETKNILPWVKNRFHYAEWKTIEEVREITVEDDITKAEQLLKKHFGYNPLNKTFNCYECGAAPPKPESKMQKYDCSICGGRKCDLHSIIDENFTCDECGKDKLCNSCLGFQRCCKDFVNGEFVNKK